MSVSIIEMSTFQNAAKNKEGEEVAFPSKSNHDDVILIPGILLNIKSWYVRNVNTCMVSWTGINMTG